MKLANSMIMRLRVDIKVTDGRLCTVKPKSNTYLNFDKWTSAFFMFVSIMLKQFPTRAQELLKYLWNIRIAQLGQTIGQNSASTDMRSANA